MNAATLRLAALAAALIDGEPVDAVECEWAKSYSKRITAEQSVTGRRAGRAEQGEMITEYFTTLPGKANARNFHRQFCDYAGRVWTHQRASAEAPRGRHGIFWRMLKAYDCVPSMRTIRRKLKLAKMTKASGGGHDIEPC